MCSRIRNQPWAEMSMSEQPDQDLTTMDSAAEPPAELSDQGPSTMDAAAEPPAAAEEPSPELTHALACARCNHPVATVDELLSERAAVMASAVYAYELEVLDREGGAAARAQQTLSLSLSLSLSLRARCFVPCVPLCSTVLHSVHDGLRCLP